MTSFIHSVAVLLVDKIYLLVEQHIAKRKHLVELTKAVTTNKSKNNKQGQKQLTKAVTTNKGKIKGKNRSKNNKQNHKQLTEVVTTNEGKNIKQRQK